MHAGPTDTACKTEDGKATGLTANVAGVQEWLDDIANDPTVEADDAHDLRDIGTALIAVDAAEANLVAAVARAREAGRDWTQIANVLGVSRQVVRQRFPDLA